MFVSHLADPCPQSVPSAWSCSKVISSTLSNNTFLPVPLVHPQNQKHLNWTWLDLPFAEKNLKSSAKKENTFAAKVVKKNPKKTHPKTRTHWQLSVSQSPSSRTHPESCLQTKSCSHKTPETQRGKSSPPSSSINLFGGSSWCRKIQLHLIAPALLNIVSILLNNGYNTAVRKDSICQLIPCLLFSLERVHYCSPVAGSLTDKQKLYLKEAGSFVGEVETAGHWHIFVISWFIFFPAVIYSLIG